MFKPMILASLLLLLASGPEVKVYKGTSRYNSDVLCTVRSGAVYKGRSNYQSDVVCTVRGNQVYKGRSNYRSDVRFTIDGYLSIEEFVAVWHAVTYVY